MSHPPLVGCCIVLRRPLLLLLVTCCHAIANALVTGGFHRLCRSSRWLVIALSSAARSRHRPANMRYSIPSLPRCPQMLSSPAAACLCNSRRWLVVASSFATHFHCPTPPLPRCPHTLSLPASVRLCNSRRWLVVASVGDRPPQPAPPQLVRPPQQRRLRARSPSGVAEIWAESGFDPDSDFVKWGAGARQRQH